MEQRVSQLALMVDMLKTQVLANANNQGVPVKNTFISSIVFFTSICLYVQTGICQLQHRILCTVTHFQLKCFILFVQTGI